MDGCIEKGSRKNAGGIISLAKAVLEYRGAIEHDLITKTGHELNDIGRTLSWGALDAFLGHTEPDSALMREINPEVSTWSSTAKTNAILADIYDLLAQLNANLVAHATGRAAKRPKLYPRPAKHDPENERHFGSKGLPPDELRKWIEEKRKQHAESSKRNHNRYTGS